MLDQAGYGEIRDADIAVDVWPAANSRADQDVAPGPVRVSGKPREAAKPALVDNSHPTLSQAWMRVKEAGLHMNNLDLANRTAIVTGGVRGIGAAVVQRLQASGARVSVWDADPGALATLAGVHTQHVDQTDVQAVQDAAAVTIAALGHIDILVNNAGITGGNAPVTSLDPATWRRVLDVNLTGPFLVTQALLPGMIAAGYGRIVNIASVAGKEGNPNAAHYSASKAGLIALTKSLGKELAHTGVLANCVTPAAAQTELFAQMTEAQIAYMLGKIPMGRFVDVQEIAALVAWLCTADCSFSTGAVFDISGGRATY